MEDPLEHALQLASSSLLPVALKTAIDLQVFDIIASFGPESHLSSSQIASHLPIHGNPNSHLALDRILALLAANSILTSQGESPTRLYGLAPVARFFTKSGSLSSFVSMMQDKLVMDIWFHLKDAVLEGRQAIQQAYKMNAFDFLKTHPDFGRLFKTSMADFNPLLMEKILRTYDGFRGIATLVDVGGGDGSVLKLIVENHPRISGINFDVPEVVESAISHPGIKHVAGDMFTSIPEGDAIFIKWVLHCWGDEECVTILRNCFNALPAKGKVIAVDMVVPGTPETETKSLHQFHLFMANFSPAGRERTETEFRSLGTAAGFGTVRVRCSACNFSVMEFMKE